MNRHRPGARPGSGSVLCIAHAGPSMHPTLRDLDLLEVVPYGGRQVKIGDVVAALPPGHEMHIVHRVVRVGADGVSTRGDNNSTEDSWRLQPSQITGRVVAAWRGRKRRKVSGGLEGRIVARLAEARRTLDRLLSRCLRPVYTFLSKRSIVRRIYPGALAPRVMRYQSRGNDRLHLQLHGRLIGEYDPRVGEWHIRRPYRILIDVEALPHGGDEASKRS